jgi:AAA family ATP:ADP antiporter
VKLITSSRYLQSTAAIIGVGILVATLVEYQFSAISSRVITDTDELTAFFGFWFSTLSVVSLGVQLGLTGPVMKRMGVTASLYFLPLGILAGTFAVLIHPGLGSAVFIKVSDGGLKHSINKAGTELLSLPLIPEIKARVKPFIDVFVDHIASGIAGVVLIVLTIVLGLGVSHISLIIMGLTGIWIYYITSIRREYVNAFRTAIEKRAINLEDQTLNLRNASLFETLVKVLEGENVRQICYVLDLIEDIRDEAFVPHLRNLIRHPSDEVKARVLRLASRYPELDFIEEAEELISSPSQDLRLEAVRFLCWKAGDRRLALEDFQDHPDYRVRASVMMCYAMVVGEKEHPLGSHELKRRLDDMLRETSHRDGEEEQQEFMRANMARVIGVAGLIEHSGTLRKFLADDSPDVLKAALVSAGKLKDQESIPILISHLRTKNMRRYARQSLAEYGEGAIGLLATYFENPSLDRNIRIALPGVLALIDSQKSMDVLTKNLAQKDPAIRYQVIKAMNRIRERFRGRRIDASVVQARILAETQEYQRSFLVLSRLKMSQSASEAQRPAGTEQSEVHDGEQLLIRALEERRDDTLERIFRLLDLLYPPGDMYNAYLGITSGKARLRADAIEFLDNVLTPALKRIIIPLVESAPSTSSFGWARGIPSPVVPSYEDAVDSILESEDVWLKACAVYLIAVFGWTYYTGYVAALTEDEDRILRETALYCQERLGKVGVLHPDIREGAPRLHGN